MAEYVFMLGRDFQLSILEIASYISARNIAYKIKAFDSKVALISFNEEIDCTRTIKKLGGTIKIAKLIASVDDIKLPDMDKIKYSIADIGSARKNEVIIKLKKRFKENGSKAYLTAEETNRGTKYVKTLPNDTNADNLLKLPECR